MNCTVCTKEFEAKRADARFCSSACRNKANRIKEENAGVDLVKENKAMLDAIMDSDDEVGSPVAQPEKEKKEENLTPDGQVRQVWDKENPIPNLENGYFHIGQTQEEYIDNLPERGYLKNGEKCEHPATESFHSRCLLCNEMIRYVRVGEAFQKATKKL